MFRTALLSGRGCGTLRNNLQYHIRYTLYIHFLTDLGEHGFAVESDDGALVDVHRDARVVEGLLGVPQLVPQVSHAALEDGAVVPRNQRPVYA